MPLDLSAVNTMDHSAPPMPVNAMHRPMKNPARS